MVPTKIPNFQICDLLLLARVAWLRNLWLIWYGRCFSDDIDVHQCFRDNKKKDDEKV